MASCATNIKVCVDKAYQNQFMKSLQQLRENDEYTDVTLQTGDVEIPCHRNVLSAASNYFKAMFRCGLKESTSDSVQLTMEPEIARSVVDYIYTGEITLTIDNADNLLKAADVLSLDYLKATCADFMIAHVDPNNCFDLWRLSALYRLDRLQKVTRQFVCAEFKTVAFTTGFKELSSTELIAFIKDDDLNVEDEDVVFDAVIGWIRHDLEQRKQYMDAITHNVRLPYCSRNCLWHMKDLHELLTPKCFAYVLEATAFQADTVNHQWISNCRTVPRANLQMTSCLLVVGGLTGEGSNEIEHNRCEYYKEDTNSWESLVSQPRSVGRFYSVCRVDRGLLLTGGQRNEVLNQCLLFDVISKKWETMPPLTTARYFHRSVSLIDRAFVIGGNDVDDLVLPSVECLDLKRRQWSEVTDMPKAVYGAAVVTYDNRIFVFGGRDAQDTSLPCTQVLDTTQGTWSSQSDSPDVCDLGSAVTLNESIYVVGGFTKTCLKYSPVSDSWTRLSRPQQKHGTAPAVVYRGSILLAGGRGPQGKSRDIEAYDPLTDTWSVCDIASLNEELRCHFMFNFDLNDL